eukprot:scaffold581676_cov15-Prasinocladus_malaysianus.AAC.1
MDERLESKLKAMLDTAAKFDFMRLSIGLSMFEPVLWPIGGTPVPKARWMALFVAVRDARPRSACCLYLHKDPTPIVASHRSAGERAVTMGFCFDFHCQGLLLLRA